MIDKAKRARILKLLSGRKADRDQALELLRTLDDPELWVEAVPSVRTHEIVGRRQVVPEDLPLLAAMPDHLPEVIALRGETRSMWVGGTVPEGVRCLTHLEHVTLAGAYGGDLPKPIEGLEHLAGTGVRKVEGFGVDLGDGAALVAIAPRDLDLRNTTWDTLPALPGVEQALLGVREGPTSLGAGMPDLRRARISGPSLVDIDALAVASRLEDLTLKEMGGLPSLDAVGRAIAAGAPLRRLVVRGVGHVMDASPLAAATGLEELRLEGAPLDDLAPLAGMTALRDLEIRGVVAEDLSPLASLTQLRSLDLRGSLVSDLRPLLGLPWLRVIAVGGSAVEPEAVPPALMPYLTWSSDPLIPALADRPAHPDDTRRFDGARA
ncbi:MAG: hypothetical protein H6738_16800 [Alphaproteobacteria bacterium]|nr:hypothetical protein [Alphaproteobacteria bacterium]MCB9698442.1 hypothetical protein [Alphaproteobacteria bacterium]